MNSDYLKCNTYGDVKVGRNNSMMFKVAKNISYFAYRTAIKDNSDFRDSN